MMYETPNPMLIFIVDTNKYAGNFERQMIAYMTGMYGDCGVGQEEAIVFYKEMGFLEKDFVCKDSHLPYQDNPYLPYEDNPFNEIITQLPDERGCFRPSAIWPNHNWFNDGNGKHYKEGTDVDKSIKKWPAYNSVATFLTEFPSQELLDIMIERAKKFVPYIASARFPTKGLNIELFRLIERRQVDRDLLMQFPT